MVFFFFFVVPDLEIRYNTELEGSLINGLHGLHQKQKQNHMSSQNSSYAGLLPVSNQPDESRKLFFWFWPAKGQIGNQDLTFWVSSTENKIK